MVGVLLIAKDDLLSDKKYRIICVFGSRPSFTRMETVYAKVFPLLNNVNNK